MTRIFFLWFSLGLGWWIGWYVGALRRRGVTGSNEGIVRAPRRCFGPGWSCLQQGRFQSEGLHEIPAGLQNRQMPDRRPEVQDIAFAAALVAVVDVLSRMHCQGATGGVRRFVKRTRTAPLSAPHARERRRSSR